MAFEPDKIREKFIARMNQGSVHQQSRTEFSNQKYQRELAGRGDAKKLQPTFLRPQDIQKGVEYDVEKIFVTTLGGELRRLVRDDLIAFSKNIELLQDHYVKGITAKQVINLSLPSDIQRANKQIFMAVPMSQKAGVVHFMTNASGENHETEHHVNVEFSGYSSLMLRPSAIALADIKSKLAYGKLKFECSCRRHTYWYRYMATIGGYGYGRMEEGYPKERNPELAGVACKHVIRVMHHMISPSFLSWISKQLGKDRSKQAGLRQKTGKKDLKKIMDEQQKQFETKAKVIKKNHNKAEAELLKRAQKVLKNQQAKLQKQRDAHMVKLAKEKGGQAVSRYKQAQRNNDLNTLKTLLRLGQITQEQYTVFSQGVLNAK